MSVERVYDAEIAQPGDAEWEASQSEWMTGHAQALLGHLRCARVAASVEPRYGRKSLELWAREMGVGRTTAYRHAEWWNLSMERFGSEAAVITRYQHSPLKPWQAIEAIKGPPELLDEAEDQNLPVREIKRRASDEPEEVEHVRETRACEACQGTGRVPVDIASKKIGEK